MAGSAADTRDPKEEVDEEVKALLIRASRAKAEAVLSPKRQENSEVSTATGEMKALQDKIRASRANAKALIAQRALRQEENENCSNLKELHRLKRRVEEEARREASLDEEEARDLKKVTQKLAKQRMEAEDESVPPEDQDQRETSAEEKEVRARVVIDEVVEAEEKRISLEAKVAAELERARAAVAEGVKAEEKQKSEKAKAAAELERAREAVEAVAKAKEKRKSEEAKVAAELERARVAVEAARRRKKEAEAAAETKSLEKVKRMTKEREQQRKKEEVAALVSKILNVYKNGKNSFYNVLGVSPSASEAEIKRAYRKLALKLHPDKDRYSMANIDEAFNAVTDAYETLKDDARRREYDLLQDGGVPPPAPATPDPLSFGTIPVGASVTILSNARFPHLIGMKGSILNFDPPSNLYSVKLDNTAVVLSDASALFQNVIVCLRARAASQLGVFLVTLSSYWSEAGSYQASYRPGSGVKEMTTLRPEQFIIPNGTVVRLPERGDTYGTVVDWKEGADDRGNDASCYEVRLSSTVTVHVKMAKVCL